MLLWAYLGATGQSPLVNKILNQGNQNHKRKLNQATIMIPQK